MTATDPREIKQCCSAIYGSDAAKMLLGESFHPGGLTLTDRLGRLTHLTPASKVLDVASGRGASAIFLAGTFGCEVVGVDLSEDNVRVASALAIAQCDSRATFRLGDAERLPFDGATFDAVICECAFCTFPDKATAASEFARVLKPGGRVGISDLTRSAAALPELDTLLAWVACIGDARPVDSYLAILRAAGLAVERTEDHSQSLEDMVREIQGKLLGVELMAGLQAWKLPGMDFAAAKGLAQAAMKAARQRQLGYAIVVATKRPERDIL